MPRRRVKPTPAPSAQQADTDHGHPDLAAATMARAERMCAERGLSFTVSRRRVLELLTVNPATPLGAYDLVELLKGEEGRRVAPVQVYRTLDFLQGLGLVHRITTRNAYLACDHEHAPDETLVFLVCQSCGTVAEASAPSAIERGLKGAAAASGFKSRHPVVEVEGECAACQAPAA